MVSGTRRYLLQAATGAVVALAGCGRIGGAESSESRSVSEGGTTVPGGTTETDPATLLIRTDTERPPVRVDGSDAGASESGRKNAPDRTTNRIIDSDAEARNLTVADAVNADRVSSFWSGTDFDAETLYLETVRVEECFRLQLCRISWSAGEIRTDYARTVRPYDERCSADTNAFETRLIRVPAALDADDVRSYGSSIRGSGRCDAPGPGTADGTGGSGNATVRQRGALNGGDQ